MNIRSEVIFANIGQLIKHLCKIMWKFSQDDLKYYNMTQPPGLRSYRIKEDATLPVNFPLTRHLQLRSHTVTHNVM